MEERKASSTPCHLEMGLEKSFEDLCSKVGEGLRGEAGPQRFQSVWKAGPPQPCSWACRPHTETCPCCTTHHLLELGQIRVKEIWECVLWSHM